MGLFDAVVSAIFSAIMTKYTLYLKLYLVQNMCNNKKYIKLF